MFVKIVRLQSQELFRSLLATPADNLGDRNLRVVVANPIRNTPKELKRANVPLLKRFGTFPWKRLAEEGVAVRQRHHTEHHLDLTATIDGFRLAEIKLGFARWMRERHEDFGRCLIPTPNRITDD